MRTNYDFLLSEYKNKMKQAEVELKAARIEALKQDQRLEIISTMKPTVADINSNIEVLSHRIDQLQKLETRIISLEENAADRSRSSNRPRKNLRITVRA